MSTTMQDASQIQRRHRPAEEVRALRRAGPAQLRVRVVRVRMELVRVLRMLRRRRPAVHLQRLLQHLALAPKLTPALLLLLLLVLLLVLVVIVAVAGVLFAVLFRRGGERRRRCHRCARAWQDERGRHRRRAEHHLPALRVLDALHPSTPTHPGTLRPQHRAHRRRPQRSAKVRRRHPTRVVPRLPARLARLAERADGHQVPAPHPTTACTRCRIGSGRDGRRGNGLGDCVVKERRVEHVVELDRLRVRVHGHGMCMGVLAA
ncbi:hypothetical protein HYPSUDRAFT_970403 [Hypholoma sublateritium FD-334 SS-4]|uniref:Uncharacterized protein n=1 Tax=Hypholoma sublateritium (strain FD-334 SS-4) TaxID=945553 RepID=A0A0D2NGE4_HYPSF|nr:hypothetical protein HYPSUDRAFT_970403 [Hypholoma sublateritium FD-334 SS-4]